MGFERVTLAGRTALLATRDREAPLARPRPFGRYRVDLEAIEEVGVPALLEALARGQVVVVDEIGPMIVSPIHSNGVPVFGRMLRRWPARRPSALA